MQPRTPATYDELFEDMKRHVRTQHPELFDSREGPDGGFGLHIVEADGKPCCAICGFVSKKPLAA